MPKKEKVTEQPKVESAVEPNDEPGQAAADTSEKPRAKTYYNPVAAKARRELIMEFAKKGGYEPKVRAPGTGLTEKRTSKTGTTYYYQPWSTLSEETKAARLAQARERAARDRELVRKYKEEHPEQFAPKETE